MSEEIARGNKTVSEGRMDRVHRLDRQQGADTGIRCPINPEHGRMGVHATGEALLCTFPVKKSSASVVLCTGHLQLSAGE